MVKIDIEMPERCGQCPCFHAENPMYYKAIKPDPNKKIIAPYGVPRPEWCPMKEQEVYKPKKHYIDEGEVYITAWWYICGYCGKDIRYRDRFCSCCGKAVKWE